MEWGRLEVRRNQIILRFIKQDQKPSFYLKAVGRHQMVLLSRRVTIPRGFFKEHSDWQRNRLDRLGWKKREESVGIHSSVIRVDGHLDKGSSCTDKEKYLRHAEERAIIHRGLNLRFNSYSFISKLLAEELDSNSRYWSIFRSKERNQCV